MIFISFILYLNKLIAKFDDFLSVIFSRFTHDLLFDLNFTVFRVKSEFSEKSKKWQKSSKIEKSHFRDYSQ